MTGWFENADAFLLGRKTYEIFNGHWPHVTDAGDPIASKLNSAARSTSPRPRFAPSAGTTPRSLGGDVAAEVAKLKERPGNELQVHGSGALAHTLIDADLIDEYRLLILPRAPRHGQEALPRRRERRAALRLLDATTTSTGVIIARYEPAGPVRSRLVRARRVLNQGRLAGRARSARARLAGHPAQPATDDRADGGQHTQDERNGPDPGHLDGPAERGAPLADRRRGAPLADRRRGGRWLAATPAPSPYWLPQWHQASLPVRRPAVYGGRWQVRMAEYGAARDHRGEGCDHCPGGAQRPRRNRTRPRSTSGGCR